MDIAAASIGLSQSKTALQAGILVMKMAMNTANTQSSDLTQMLAECTKTMEQSVNPELGANIDITA